MTTGALIPPRNHRSLAAKVTRALLKAPWSARIAVFIILVYLISAIFAPLIAPYGQAEIVGKAYQPGGTHSQFLLGTDQIGRDIFSRLIFGARNTISVALVTTFISFLVGISLGVAAALYRGWTDQVLSRIVDALLAMPALIFALMLLAIFGRGVVNLIAILAMLDSTRVFRLSRAAALSVTVMDFVEAARLRGEGATWIVFKEIIPNIAAPLLTEFGLRFSFVFLTISALSFLGVGIQPPTADWGSMVAESKSLIIYGNLAPFYPAGAIVLLTVAVNFVVDWLLQSACGFHDEH
ncbi:ABC transporter permease [Mesorhizobium sp. B3-1-3]|uniref:ABC transporter permease n=1 Tax=unclassified Mesorhizobium TaxID=325217 RepID=UPI001126EBC8|nr:MULTISPECIES: ABC transporter permease [unclassified Mesorhizobium]TPI56044.1 ABC transporter permease [Mesorhizobium sp. B3-1-8]TPI63338.1 ABC transporter permease [Mesorhizobium sp. B3-1-3]